MTEKVTASNSDSEDDDFVPPCEDNDMMKQTFSWFRAPETSTCEETVAKTNINIPVIESLNKQEMSVEKSITNSNIELPAEERSEKQENTHKEGITVSNVEIKKKIISKKQKRSKKKGKSDDTLSTEKKNENQESLSEENISESNLEPTGKKSKKRKRPSLNVSSTSEWDVKLMDDNIDVVFEELEKKINDKLEKEESKMKKKLAPKKNSKTNKKVDKIEKEEESLLALPIERKRPKLDEPLLQTTAQTDSTEGELSDLSNILNKKKMNIDINETVPQETKKIEKIKKKKQKVTELDTSLPDFLTNMDDDEELDIFQQELKEEAADAFADDLANQFAKEKAETIEKDKPKDVDLFLPGWGSWGGVGIVPSKRKRRRFIIKAPKKVPRRDDNKGFLIINEDADKKVKKHMVNELPFPFQRVKDFEASIRAPVGRSFVPEIAFRKLTKPAIKTKMGTIIEPMDKDVLIEKSRL